MIGKIISRYRVQEKMGGGRRGDLSMSGQGGLCRTLK